MTTQEKYFASFTTSHVISSLIFAKEVNFNLPFLMYAFMFAPVAILIAHIIQTNKVKIILHIIVCNISRMYGCVLDKWKCYKKYFFIQAVLWLHCVFDYNDCSSGGYAIYQ